jgi:hypothetical protein
MCPGAAPSVCDCDSFFFIIVIFSSVSVCVCLVLLSLDVCIYLRAILYCPCVWMNMTLYNCTW